MVTLYLARHGETEENVAGVLQGHLPGRLTQRGMEQAHELAASLPQPPYFHALLASDLRRTLQTAEIVSPRAALPITPCPLLRERDWGSLTGRPVTEARLCAVFPPDVESVEAMHARAKRFLSFLMAHHDEQRVLAVGHGLFSRCIQATAQGCSIGQVPRWDNAELRELRIDGKGRLVIENDERAVSAD